MDPFPSPQSNPKLLTALRAKLRMGHYSLRTEEAYAYWVRRFVQQQGNRHPRDLGVYYIRTLQEILGHRDVSVTMQYTHVLNRRRLGVRSPLDLLAGNLAVLPD